MIGAEVGLAAVATGASAGRRRIAEEALADAFGIEMPAGETSAAAKAAVRRAAAPPLPEKPSASGPKRAPARKTPPGNKAAAAAQKTGDAKRAVRAVAKTKSVTGKTVANLRAKFGMSPSQFARLLGVSAPALANWEAKQGAVGFQSRTLDAWNAAAKLTKAQAWRVLGGS